jgi:hypothetical protein
MNTTNVAFSPEAMDVVLTSLKIMGEGMLGIFVFMLVFYMLILGLEKVFSNK